MSKSTRSNFITYAIVIIAYVILQFMMSQGMISSSLGGQMVPICVYIVMAVSLNLTGGYSGGTGLGHAGFMSVGAFSGVVAAISLQSVIPNGALRLIAAR